MFDGSLLNSLLLVPVNDLSKIGTVILCSSVIRNKRLLDLNSNFKYFGYVSKYNALCVNFRIENSIRLMIGNQPRLITSYIRQYFFSTNEPQEF